MASRLHDLLKRCLDRVQADHRAVLCLPESAEQVTAQTDPHPADQIGWHRCATRRDDLKRGHVALGSVQRFQQIEQHGGNGKTGCDALFLYQSRKDIRVEPLDQQHLGRGLEASQGPRRTARRVKQRHEIGPDRMRPHLLARAEQPRVVHKVLVAEHRALGKSGCSRGVLDLRGIVRLDVR